MAGALIILYCFAVTRFGKGPHFRTVSDPGLFPFTLAHVSPVAPDADALKGIMTDAGSTSAVKADTESTSFRMYLTICSALVGGRSISSPRVIATNPADPANALAHEVVLSFSRSAWFGSSPVVVAIKSTNPANAVLHVRVSPSSSAMVGLAQLQLA